nr:hypothetical protein [Pseudomonas aeruginosa]
MFEERPYRRAGRRAAQQGRGHRRRTGQLCGAAVGGEFAQAAPVVHGEAETFEEVPGQQSRRFQCRTFEDVGFLLLDGGQLARGALVDRQEVQAVMGVAAGEVGQFVSDHCTQFGAVQQAQQR